MVSPRLCSGHAPGPVAHQSCHQSMKSSQTRTRQLRERVVPTRCCIKPQIEAWVQSMVRRCGSSLLSAARRSGCARVFTRQRARRQACGAQRDGPALSRPRRQTVHFLPHHKFCRCWAWRGERPWFLVSSPVRDQEPALRPIISPLNSLNRLRLSWRRNLLSQLIKKVANAAKAYYRSWQQALPHGIRGSSLRHGFCLALGAP